MASKQLCPLLFLSSKAVCYTNILKKMFQSRGSLPRRHAKMQETLETVSKSSFCVIFPLSSLNTPLWSLYYLITLSCCNYLQTLGYSLSFAEDFWKNQCIDYSFNTVTFWFHDFPSFMILTSTLFSDYLWNWISLQILGIWWIVFSFRCFGYPSFSVIYVCMYIFLYLY